MKVTYNPKLAAQWFCDNTKHLQSLTVTNDLGVPVSVCVDQETMATSMMSLKKLPSTALLYMTILPRTNKSHSKPLATSPT
jgi:hypothetical protein